MKSKEFLMTNYLFILSTKTPFYFKHFNKINNLAVHLNYLHNCSFHPRHFQFKSSIITQYIQDNRFTPSVA